MASSEEPMYPPDWDMDHSVAVDGAEDGADSAEDSVDGAEDGVDGV